MQFDGKIAVVTGGAAGIGAACAASLAEHGAHVVLADVADAGPAVLRLKEEGLSAEAFRLDVADAEGWRALAGHLDRTHGGLDFLINNAGLYASLTRGPFEDLPDEEWHRVMNVNVFSIFAGCKAMLPSMRRRGGGRIVNMSSASVYKAPANILHYATSKAAVSMMTQIMSRELGADNILVNAVAPGFTLSDGVMARSEPIDAQRAMNNAARALNRDQYPDDIAKVVRFLCSEDASFVTGQNLVVDGGIVTR